MAVFFIFGLLLLFYISYRLYQHFFPAPNINPNGKYVLISGCDSGFGHALAIQLDRQGFNVLAGVLVADTVTSLKAELTPKATIFQLDITKQEDIDAAYDLVKDKTSTLHALVNNAGIGGSGYVDWMSMQMLRRTMEVNFFGHVAMTKKFLPLLINKRDSRVVNICSVAGYLSLAGMCAYCASKYALESFSDCLRREMFPWNLRVSIVEPGFMRTPIIQGVNRPFSDFWGILPNDIRERWGEDFLRNRYEKVKENKFIKHAENPIKVVRVLQHAVMSSAPRIRYRPGWQSSFVFFPISMLPAWIADRLLVNINKADVSPASVSKQIQN